MIWWPAKDTDGAREVPISSWLLMMDGGTSYHPWPPWEDLEKHLCAHTSTLSLCWQIQRNARDAFEAAVRNAGGVLASGAVHRTGHHRGRGYLAFILSRFKTFVETSGGFGLVAEWHFVTFTSTALVSLFLYAFWRGTRDYCVGLWSVQTFIIIRCIL